MLGSREKEVKALDCAKCSGVLVIGGDGTVSEVLYVSICMYTHT